MPISDWFRAREARRYVQPTAPGETSEVPDGVWVKCDECRRIVYQGELEKNLQVCPYCGDHRAITALERVAMLVDAGSFEEVDPLVCSLDPLTFSSGKAYVDVVTLAEETTGLKEAIVTGTAGIGEHPAVVGAMDFRFVGGSMGSAVGEKISRAFELALEKRMPVVLCVTSGGARMQESILSLMQMAKTSASAGRLAGAGIPYIAVLSDPAMGGVTASFAAAADLIIAEPRARVGFAGPRLVEETIRRSLPKGFQSSEFLLEHGMVDDVVDRRELRDRIIQLLDYVTMSRS